VVALRDPLLAARVELLAGYAVANAPERPVWREGDVLGRLFGGKK
jgi:hypothetical protein